MSEAFPCTGCGACCRSILRSEKTSALDRGDGTCRYLDDKENLCIIYENRPDICNIQNSYEKSYKSLISWSEFVDLNQIACNELLKQQSLASKV